MNELGNNNSQSNDALLEELSEFCRSESLSKDGLRGIIEKHGCAPKNNDPNINNYDFFRRACRNASVTEGILRYLLEYFPNAARHAGVKGRLPLHIICRNKNVTGMVQLLIDAFPESVRHESNSGCTPLHDLCCNDNLDDEIGLEILKLFLERCPESVRHAASDGILPIHFAAARQSPEFCHMLIKAYPGSERAVDNDGRLPLDIACQYNTVATAKYLYQLYPESINVADNGGFYPIHSAIWGLKNRSNLKDGIEVVKFLLDCNPVALGSTGQTPLHIAFNSKHVTLNMVQLLIDAFPEFVRHEDNNGYMPLHTLCRNDDLDDDDVGLVTLKLLLKRCPESVRQADRVGRLPLHIAARKQSPEFCRILIEAYPGSERISNAFVGILPFHYACQCNTVATAEYLYTLYPESIDVADNAGYYPIHRVIFGIKYRADTPETAVEMTQFLLGCNPDVVLQECNGILPFIFRGKFPLYWVCREATENTTKLNAYLKVLQMLYNAHPEAIESNELTSNIDRFCQEVQTFINTQLTYARQARDRTLMNTRDENEQLPLHKALRDNVTLGSIKLSVKGNPSAITCADNRGMIPLHVACQHHETPAVVEYLLDLDPTALRTIDFERNTALHHACRGANHAIIALLTEKYGAVSVSKRNAHGQLPIDLLLQNKNEVRDEESLKYTESIYRLLRAYPMTLMHYDLGQANSEDCLSQQNKKKRKIDEVYGMCIIQ